MTVSGRCPDCGSELAEGARFCPNCGRAIPEEPAAAATTPQAPAGQTVMQENRAPQQSAAPASSPPPPPGAQKSRRGWVLGGCAVAGVLGLLAVLVVGAGLFLLAFSSSPEPQPQEPPAQPEQPAPQPDPQPQPDPAPQPQPEPAPQPQPAPDEGSLDGLVQQQVGDYTLQQVEPVPDLTSAGATDARQMLYTASDGTEVLHILSAWSSSQSSNEALVIFVETLRSEGGYEVTDEMPLTSDSGEEIGTAVLLTGPDEVVVWSNQELFAVVEAPEGYAQGFFEDVAQYY